MDIHENARTTPRSRMLIVERLEAGSTVAAVAPAFGVDGRTVRKWRDRFRVEGAAGLGDRSSRPHSCPFRLDAAAEAEIESLRRQRLSRPAIARRLGRPVSTVGKVAAPDRARPARGPRPRPQSSATSGSSPAN